MATLLGSAHLSFPLSLQWRHSPPQQSSNPTLQTHSALTKQGQRFLTKLASHTDDPSLSTKLISKFISSSPKSTSLTTLSYLLSPHTSHPHLSSLALPMYYKITEASWFEWNPKLGAALVALLDKQGLHSQCEALISETVLKLGTKEREVAQFYCQLVESHAKMGSRRGFDMACGYLYEMLECSRSVYVKRRVFEALVGGLCAMDRPGKAEELIEGMRVKGVKASVFEFRSVVYGYGRLGMFEEMLKAVGRMEKQGFGDDTICCNMVLSSYGAFSELGAMAMWLRKMKELSVPFSIRTYNSVLNSCPRIMAMLQEPKGVACSLDELTRILDGDEALVVKELVGSAVVDEAMVWDTTEVKLDLHGMHLGSAYMVMLEWFEVTKKKFESAECVVPAEVVIVCGLGKHSSVRGESPVKDLVNQMMHKMGSPMRIDRKNVGCFIAKGRAVKDWLL